MCISRPLTSPTCPAPPLLVSVPHSARLRLLPSFPVKRFIPPLSEHLHKGQAGQWRKGFPNGNLVILLLTDLLSFHYSPTIPDPSPPSFFSTSSIQAESASSEEAKSE